MNNRLLTTITAFLLIIAIVGALSFTSAPVINEGNDADTTETLVCEWASSGDTTSTNVTWYRDGAHFKNITSATSPNSISSSNTSRGQTWECVVSISNGTSTINNSDTIDIVNANPDEIFIYNESAEDIGNSTIILEDVARTFDANSTDPDGDSVTYATQDLPSGASFNSGTGVMTWTPTANDVGTHNVTFIALDDQSPDKGSRAEDVIFTVQEVNDDPTFSPALSDQQATETQPFTYSISVADEEDDFPINFTISSDIDDLIINSTGSNTADITFADGQPGFEDRGNHTITVNITDSRNGTTSDTFNIEVITVNAVPVLAQIPNASGTQGNTFFLLVNATDREINDTLTFSIEAMSCSISNPWTITKDQEIVQGNESFANATIDTTLTNNHIACPQVNISVTDGKETDSQVVYLNLTNVNDAPVLNEISTSPVNNGGNNITNQSTFILANYRYQVNATDIDSITPNGENLSYTDNTTLFNINTTTGLIAFTPSSGDIGNHSILITVTDDEGLNDSRVMNIEINNNSAPQIDPIGSPSCAEDVQCTIYITATDDDGDSINFTSNNPIFNITQFNSTAARLQTTYNQSQIGNYSVTITATDSKSATDTATFNFTINNTNDAPVMNAINIPTPIVATYSVSFDVTASDQDIDLYGGGERLNYSRVFLNGSTIFNITTIFDSSTNISTGRIQFTPAISEVGNYSVNITVNDSNGGIDSQVINFEVLNKTNPPNISQIIPYGTPISNVTVFEWRNTSDFPDTNTSINTTENTTILFNHTTTDDTTPLSQLNFTWQVDGSNVSTNHSLNYEFDFFSSGNREIKLMVEDTRRENSSWTWNVDVTNINRPPLLLNPLENVSISTTETFTNYLELRSDVKFIDPDDDVDGDNELDANETNTLSFTSTSCDVADLTITGSTVRFEPTEVGECTVTFNATDTSGASLASNVVQVNVTNVPNSTTTTTETVVVSSSSGGGGGSSSIVIPREVEVDTPHPLDLITPGEVTIYENQSITIPILLHNTWNGSISGVRLSAYSNITGVNIGFDNTYFEEIENDGQERVMMTVSGYRLGENFEIVVNVSVEDPEFQDSELILFNSIEQTMRGEEVRIMVTFARDLLTQNEECQELGELLNRAENTFQQGSYQEASAILDTVINGCRYLVSRTQVEPEQPARFDLGFLERFNWFYIGTGVLLVAFLAAIVIIEMKIRKEENSKEA